jgi:hypothetical protein
MYRVHGNDGNTYEASSLAVLQEWANEGRVIKTTVVEDLLSGTEGPAGAIEGLLFSSMNGPIAEGGAVEYPRFDPAMDWTVHLPLVKAIVSALCFSPIGIVAVIYAARVPEILARGDKERARRAIRMANFLANLALFVGMAWIFVQAKYIVPLMKL